MGAKRKTRPAARPGTRPRRAADSADRAYRAIRQWIIEFKLRPEERLNELHLAKKLGLSRTPVREALNRLASEGFLVFVPNRGFFCRSLDIADLVGVFEMRSVLERGAFELACKRAPEAGIAALERFWTGAQRNYRRRDTDEMLSLDEAFHRQLAELSGNREIVRGLAAIDAQDPLRPADRDRAWAAAAPRDRGPQRAGLGSQRAERRPGHPHPGRAHLPLDRRGRQHAEGGAVPSLRGRRRAGPLPRRLNTLN